MKKNQSIRIFLVFSIAFCFAFSLGVALYTTSSYGSEERYSLEEHTNEEDYKEFQREVLAQANFEIHILKRRQLYADLTQENFEERLNLALRDHEIQEKEISEDTLNIVTELNEKNRDALTEKEFQSALKKAIGLEIQERKLKKYGGGKNDTDSDNRREESPYNEEISGNSAFFPEKKKLWQPDFWHGAALGVATMAGIFFFTKSKGNF